MHVSSLIMLVAGAVSAVAQTTTATSYLTATVTITKCNPTNTACPLYTPSTSSTPVAYPTSSVAQNTTTSSFTPSSSSSTWYPISKNSTVSAGPTAYPNVSSSYVVPSTYATLTSVPTTPAPAPSTPASSATPSVPASGAGLVSVQSGLLMGLVGMGIALLA